MRIPLLLCLALVFTSYAQAAQDAPKPKPFLTARNASLLAVSSAAISADGFTTQRFLDSPLYHEANPLTRAFGNSRPATTGAGALAFAGVVGGMYVAHRHGWRHVEWILPAAVTAVETGFAIHNARLSLFPLKPKPGPLTPFR